MPQCGINRGYVTAFMHVKIVKAGKHKLLVSIWFLKITLIQMYVCVCMCVYVCVCVVCVLCVCVCVLCAYVCPPPGYEKLFT